MLCAAAAAHYTEAHVRGECAHVARTPLDLHSEKDSLENCCLAHTTAKVCTLFWGKSEGLCIVHTYMCYSEQADANFLGSGAAVAEATLFAGHQSLKRARGGCFTPSHFNCTKALVIQGTEKSQGLPKRFD